KPNQVFLVIDGIPYRQDTADGSMDTIKKVIGFTLHRNKNNPADLWNAFYNGDKSGSMVKIELARKSDGQLISSTDKLNFTLCSFDGQRYVYALLSALSLIIFCCLIISRYDQMIRDAGDCSGGNPFSLAKTQFAFWTITVLSSFIFLTILHD